MVDLDVVAVTAAPAVKAIGNSDHAICGGEDRRTLGAGDVGACVGTALTGNRVHAMAELRCNCSSNGQWPLQSACRGAGAVRGHKFTAALRKATEQFCPQFLVLRVLQQLQVVVLASGEMVVCGHFVRRFVGKAYHKNGFGDFCGGGVAVLVGSIYGDSLRVGGVVHFVHRPHSFPQLVHLIFRQRRHGCALLIT